MSENLDEDKILRKFSRGLLIKHIAFLKAKIDELEEENGVLQDRLDAHCEGCELIKH
jgi:hypothetical protein